MKSENKVVLTFLIDGNVDGVNEVNPKDVKCVAKAYERNVSKLTDDQHVGSCVQEDLGELAVGRYR